MRRISRSRPRRISRSPARSSAETRPALRIGFGYDIHPLVRGRPLVLGGVKVDSDLGLQGHSDADVLSHAVGEAILGAGGMGDLGRHFPAGHPAFRNISSLILLERVAARVRRRGWSIAQIDATLVLQAPRVAHRLGAMAERIARALGVQTATVNVKAKNPEGLGPEGHREGVSAYAVALLLPR